MARTEDTADGPQPGDQVGLGRVVHTGPRRSDAHSPDEVQEGSEESFPASDAPSFTGARPAGGDATSSTGDETVELPDPRDVP